MIDLGIAMPQSVAFAFCHDDMVYVSIIGICVDGVFDGLCCIMERLFSVAWGRCWEMIVYRTIRYIDRYSCTRSFVFTYATFWASVGMKSYFCSENCERHQYRMVGPV